MTEKVLNLFIDAKTKKPENSISFSDFNGKLISILGVRGTGKSNTAGVVVENIFDLGIGMTIFDSEGEYWGLKQNYEVLICGGSHKDIDLNVEYASELARSVLQNNIRIIIDMSELLHEERNEFLYNYVTSLWDFAHNIRRLHYILIEECHEFIPQGIKSPLKEKLTQIALKGRKWGLNPILVSQRSANVEKDILTQSEIYFLHKVTHSADFKVYADLIGYTQKQLTEQLDKFDKGMVFYKNNQLYIKRIRKQSTYHAGFTPDIDTIPEEPPNLKDVSKELLKVFEDITIKEKIKKDEIHLLKDQINRKDAIIMENEKKINTMEQQIDILSKIKVEIALPDKQFIQEAIFNSINGNPIQNNTNIVNSNKIETDQLNNLSNISFEKPIDSIIKKIIKKIDKLNGLSLDIANLIIQSETGVFSIRKLAGYFDKANSTISANYPSAIEEMITKNRNYGEEMLIKSNLKQYLNDKLELYKDKISDSKIDEIYQYIKKYLEFKTQIK